MSFRRWQRIEEALEGALAEPPERRQAFLEEACGGDAGLMREVEELIAADAGAGSFLEEPPSAQAEVSGVAPGGLAGRRLGPYRLEQPIGRGGMSTVYLALRDDGQYRRRVAVKVLRRKPGRLDLAHRFRAERQILAQLDHPAIVRLLDGGVSEEGVPYLVMEHVEGTPIDRYCDRHRLGVGERVDLFCRVAEAVEHAHRNLVVHRDLKPGHLLVTAQGEPKLLDFGIAKLLSPQQFPFTVAHTTTRMRLMTPPWASPEQVRGEPVSTASDVYSLGVILYQLLTGRLPYRLVTGTAGELERAIAEQEPERPGLAAGREEEVWRPEIGGREPLRPRDVARARATRPADLGRRLAGDLDAIVLKALRKEPRRRYGSVAQLAEDLRRWRDGRPVEARRGSSPYLAGKFLRRHRVGVGVAAAFLLLLVAFAAAMGVQAGRLARERDRAVAAQREAEVVADLLYGVFEMSDPGSSRGDPITGREVLLDLAKKIPPELRDQAQLQADLMAKMAHVYTNLGLYEVAESLARSALASRRAALGWEHAKVADSLNNLGVVLRQKGELEEAEATHRECLELRRRRGTKDAALAESLNNLGVVLWARGAYQEAESLLREATGINRHLLGDEHEAVASNLNNLAELLCAMGRYEEAELLQRESMELFHRLYGEENSAIARSYNNLGLIREALGDYEGAVPLYLKALDIHRRIFGNEHPHVAMTLNNLAGAYLSQGDYEAAELSYRDALNLQRRVLGDDHPDVVTGFNNLSLVLILKGDLGAAEPFAQEALTAATGVFGSEHPMVAGVENNLGLLRLMQGDFTAAEEHFRRALSLRIHLLGETHDRVAVTLSNLALALLAKKEDRQAEKQARESLAILRQSLPEGHWRIANAESVLGAALAGQGRHEEAEELLVASYPVISAATGARSFYTRQALERLVRLYESWGRTDQAAVHRARRLEVGGGP